MKVAETVLALRRRIPKSSREDERLKLDMLIYIREVEDEIKKNPPKRTKGDARKRLPGSKRYLAEKVGVSASRIVAWKKKYSEGGIVNLLAKRIQLLKISRKAEELTIDYMRHNPGRLSFAKIHAKVQVEFPNVKYSNLIKHIKRKFPSIHAHFLRDRNGKS